MVAHITACPSSVMRGRAPPSISYSRLLAAGLVLAVLGGCGSLPPAPQAGPNPADPSAPARPTAYRSIVGPYTRGTPVGAGSWQEQNERIAPQVKP